MGPERRLLVPALALLCLLPPGPGSRAEEGTCTFATIWQCLLFLPESN